MRFSTKKLNAIRAYFQDKPVLRAFMEADKILIYERGPYQA